MSQRLGGVSRLCFYCHGTKSILMYVQNRLKHLLNDELDANRVHAPSTVELQVGRSLDALRTGLEELEVDASQRRQEVLTILLLD